MLIKDLQPSGDSELKKIQLRNCVILIQRLCSSDFRKYLDLLGIKNTENMIQPEFFMILEVVEVHNRF